LPSSKSARLSVELRDGIFAVTLNRPDVSNAIDGDLASELIDVLRSVDRARAIRVVMLRGTGKNFCAGADLNWMLRASQFSKAQNLADARRTAKLLSTLASLSKPTVARVQGGAFGFGVGLVACCDIVIASDDARFALSEAKFGLIATTVGAYVTKAIGPRQARALMLSAAPVSAVEALRIGLIHDVVPPLDLDGRIDDLLRRLIVGGPAAQAKAKSFIADIAGRPLDTKLLAMTTRYTAAIRSSSEAKEGMAAFLAKRPPNWVKKTRS